MEDEDFKNPLACQIWDKVYSSFSAYADDSPYSKAMLPIEIMNEFHFLAEALACMTYSPRIKFGEINDTFAYSHYLFLMSCGKQVYLTERSFLTLGKPYQFKTDPEDIIKMRSQSMNLLLKQMKMSKSVREVMEKILERFNEDFKDNAEKFQLPGRRLKINKLKDYLHGSLCFGYVFTGKMVEYNP